MALTDKNREFCKYYACIEFPDTNGNGAQSVIKAGYSVTGAKQKAYELLKKGEVRTELERIYTENASIIDLNPLWVKNQCYLMYNRCKDNHDAISARAFLDLAGKCVGAYQAKAIDNSIELEPIEPEQRKEWLLSELGILDEMSKAGDGLPKIEKNNE